MNDKDYMALEYADVQEGETRAGQTCPSCKGGASGERSMSVSRKDGRLLWICHRSSCPFRGSTGTSFRTGERTVTESESVRGIVGRTFVRQSDSIPTEVINLLGSRYHIGETHVARYGLGWSETKDNGSRLVIPVKDYYGEVRGCALRSFDGSQPKSKSHTEKGALSWFVKPTATKCIIVEDQLSAIRASDYLTSVALLGTHINESNIQEIVDTGLAPVYLALDADAYNKAVNYVMRFRSLLRMRLVKLEKDIKDMSPDELEELMQVYEI